MKPGSGGRELGPPALGAATGTEREDFEARYRALFESAHVGILVADARSVYLDANPTACEMLGYSHDELVGRHAADIVATAEVPQIDAALGDLETRADHRREWRFRRKDGSHFPAEVVATRLPDGTLLGVLRDASDRDRAHAYREHLAALVESSRDAIFGTDLRGVVTSWNAGAEATFGWSAAEMVGSPLARMIPEDRREEEDRVLERLGRGERVELLETLRRTRDGRLIDASVTVSPIRDARGAVVGASRIARDISGLKARALEIERLSRLYAALSQVNQAIVWMQTREDLFRKVCRLLVEHGGFRMAWIGWHDAESRRLVPVAEWGDDGGYLRGVEVRTDDRTEGQGPSGTAFRSGRSVISNDLLEDASTVPWRAERERRGLLASAAFPIRMQGEVRGTLNVYADRRGYFHDQEVALLEEAVAAISFALDNFARDEARRLAERTLRNEKLFSDMVIESLPGIVYFYDADGRFLRWNRNFEAVSGCSREEIAGMHPLDFFAERDRPRIERSMAEVLAAGESAVEADFVSRDGTATPYYFTGRRVPFEDRSCLVGVGVDLSGRRRAEARLTESERKYRELVENANSIILRWNAEGRITFLNEFGQRFFGYDAEEIVGRHVMGTIVPSTESGGRDLRQLMEEVCSAPENFGQNLNQNMRRNGERAWIAWTNRIVRDAEGRAIEFLSIGTDVTEAKRAEARLRESEAHLVEAQRIAKIGSWELDVASRELRWSDQVYELFGLRKEHSASSYEAFLAFVHPEDRERLGDALQAATSGRARLDVEHRVVLRDGSEKVVHELGDLRRDDEGRPALLAGTVHDITDRVHIAAEREKRLRAEAADRVKSAFLATMSHELRTPLNSIIGFTGIVLQGLAGPLNSEQGKQLGMVRASARHLLALVNDVLDLSKIEAGQLEVAREPFDPRRSIAKVTALVAPQAEARGLALRVEVASALGEAVGDERRFEQILLNLLSNGIKFTEQGEVALVAEKIVEAGAAGVTGRSQLRVGVHDTGMGIRPEDLPTLFQPFRQIDSGLTRRHDGTGLGLVICRRLATLMGGAIEAESEWGRGSTFTLTLPMNGAAEA